MRLDQSLQNREGVSRCDRNTSLKAVLILLPKSLEYIT